MFDLTKLNISLMKLTSIFVVVILFISLTSIFIGIDAQYKNILQTALSSLFVFLTTLCLMNLADVVQKSIIKKIGFVTLILTLLGVSIYFFIYFFFNSLIVLPRIVLAIPQFLLLANLFLIGKHTKITGFDLVAGFFILGIFIADIVALAAYFILIMLLFRINEKLEKINKVDRTLGITQNTCPVCGKKLGFSYLECSSCKRHFCYEHARHEGGNVYCFDCLRKTRR